MADQKIRETDLYPPIKAFLEHAGYEVKAEVQGCDVVASRGDEPIAIIELKTSLSLDLVLQGVERQAMSENIYLAVPAPDTPAKRRNWRSRRRGILGLCRRLGLGLMTVDLARSGVAAVTVLADPAPYQPRKSKTRHTRLLAEFKARVGDPNTGGQTRQIIVTAYRQDALRCATYLSSAEDGIAATKDIREHTGVPKAATILQNNHYGWFERVSRGRYRLTESGTEALETYSTVVESLLEQVNGAKGANGDDA